MSRINQELLGRIKSKLGISQSRAYALIDEKVRSLALPRNLAAIALAAERGINISRFASREELAEIRSAGASSAPAPVVVPGVGSALGTNGRSRARSPGTAKAKAKATALPRRGTTVFVVHGRNVAARDAVFAFLRAIGLQPLEWSQALKATGKPSPYVGEILDAAFRTAAAVVVLLTPDDEAMLKPMFLVKHDPSYEKKLTGQARPNVLFEAGMAFGKDANSTVLVQIGDVRPFSDVAGRHVLHLNNSAASRSEFATRLANAGCNVNTTGQDWFNVGDFILQPKRKK